MKPLSETRALEKLREVQTEFARHIRANYEHRAKSCGTCKTPGACCLDAHFVNVQITQLEAVAIRKVIDSLPAKDTMAVRERIARTIVQYDLASESITNPKTYACPLYEKGTGCLVHDQAKPLPCIAHACYDNQKDLPPDELLAEHEGLVEKLNELTYRKKSRWLPLPVAIQDSSG